MDARWHEIFARAGLGEGTQVLLKRDKGEVRSLDRDCTVEWRAGVSALSFPAEGFRGQKAETSSRTAAAFREENLPSGKVRGNRFVTRETGGPSGRSRRSMAGPGVPSPSAACELPLRPGGPWLALPRAPLHRPPAPRRGGHMRIGIACLVGAYVLSQFYRAFLAVLTPDLGRDLGATAGDLALASGLWFLAFAAMQIPVGAALDRLGPRRTAAVLLASGGGGGALLFALAQSPGQVMIAMALIGAGCSPVLMAAYVIYARVFPPRVFATLAGATVGLGSLGNVLSAAPLAALVEAVGWRASLAGLAAVTLLVAGILWVAVRDPAPAQAGPSRGSVLDLLRMPALWPILVMMFAGYGPAASLRGLWAGPYARDLFGADAALIGWVTLAMGLAMVLGNFLYGPADRILGTRKWVVFGGNAMVLLALLWLALDPSGGLVQATVLLAVAGLFGSAFPLIMGHARALFPPHLTGRGVTLVNMFGIGGAGLMQVASRPVHGAFADPAAAYRALFLFFALVVALGLAAYWPSRDSRD